jgi:hypothetical protein
MKAIYSKIIYYIIRKTVFLIIEKAVFYLDTLEINIKGVPPITSHKSPNILDYV